MSFFVTQPKTDPVIKFFSQNPKRGAKIMISIHLKPIEEQGASLWFVERFSLGDILMYSFSYVKYVADIVLKSYTQTNCYFF